MDNSKVGQLIFQLRREKGLTQQQLAEMLHISNKAVSKWECGHGAPDIALLGELSSVLGADIQGLLQGELNPNRTDTGKIDRTRILCLSCLREYPDKHRRGKYFLLRSSSYAADTLIR